MKIIGSLPQNSIPKIDHPRRLSGRTSRGLRSLRNVLRPTDLLNAASALSTPPRDADNGGHVWGRRS